MYEYIDSEDQLRSFVNDIKDVDWIALDTEFIREKHYYAELCLVQVATKDRLVCIDPMAIKDLSAFAEILNNSKIIKVLHAAFQDLEIFYNLFERVPAPIFDSQLAAAVLGIGDQIGYARLIQDCLKVQLEKSQSRTNWAQRPLSTKQLDYAIDDVRYLREVYPMLIEKLEKLGRTTWLDKDFDYLTEASTYEADLRTIWQKVKGSQRLKPKQLAVLRELGDWRESMAIKKNLPRRWMASDDVLLEIAQQMPQQPSDFSHFRGLNENNPHIKDWIQCVEIGLAVPDDEWPRIAKFNKPTEQQALLIDLLMLIVRHQGVANNISPAVIAGRKRVEKMLLAGETSLSNDWRGHLVNEQFQEVLTGEAKISVEDARKVVIN
ncbi:MAG: Ribonuclease D (EC [uncultured Thiotrichaceae bacterium]|uniref:Ribonuclease D n=1 Tax=uncultured Thiotrichaceae bacterium TaxID=298394 RepID=A0A6S6TBP6_9GAMM|nr:MAG: Ribonuclease D (EC [uncultured Thiotrichaceae bacterium]